MVSSTKIVYIVGPSYASTEVDGRLGAPVVEVLVTLGSTFVNSAVKSHTDLEAESQHKWNIVEWDVKPQLN